MDKFKLTLPPKSKTVVCRDCDMSSVVRQPPQKTEDELDDTVIRRPGTEEIFGKKILRLWLVLLSIIAQKFIFDWSKDKVPMLLCLMS